MEVPEEKAKEIGELIELKNSPVGIDAKKTHIIIIHKLTEIERRLKKLEDKFNKKQWNHQISSMP